MVENLSQTDNSVEEIRPYFLVRHSTLGSFSAVVANTFGVLIGFDGIITHEAVNYDRLLGGHLEINLLRGAEFLLGATLTVVADNMKEKIWKAEGNRKISPDVS